MSEQADKRQEVIRPGAVLTEHVVFIGQSSPAEKTTLTEWKEPKDQAFSWTKKPR